MILSILIEIENTNWLKYILDEFKRIQSAEFQIELIYKLEEARSSNIIRYTKQKTNETFWIPEFSCIKPEGEIKFIKEEIYIIDKTYTNEETEINYDIFWNSFIFLSRLEEYNSEITGKKIQSYSFNHPRKDKSSFDIPIVNILFMELEKFIIRNFPNLKFRAKVKPIIEFSHDVDYIHKTIQLRIKQTIFNLIKTIQLISSPKLFFSELKNLFKFFFSNPSYWCFDYWENLEKQFGVRSIFYIYAKFGKKNFRSWLIDPSYDISKNEKLQIKLKNLYKDGFQIGLHGSFDSALDLNLLKKEKEILEESLQIKITKTRQHWLRYEEQITPFIHESIFEFDASLSWNDRMGFRSGVASKYIPFNHKINKPFSYMITPTILMDSNVYDYGVKNKIELESKAMSMLVKLNEYTNTFIAISWHQRVCSTDYNWHYLYEAIIK